MISKAAIQRVRALSLKKNRYKERLFVAEGHKTVNDLLGYFRCRSLYATDRYVTDNPLCERITYDELRSISQLETPQDVLAVFEMPSYHFDASSVAESLVLALDNVQDAGNLGTIIRIADWFGIEDIVCSIGTVDVFNPKCIQATMGAVSRVRVHYLDLTALIKSLPAGTSVYATTLDGTNIYDTKLTTKGMIVMGNEGNGISNEVRALCNTKLFIPNFPIGRATSESLNVGVATAVICAEFRRQDAFDHKA